MRYVRFTLVARLFATMATAATLFWVAPGQSMATTIIVLQFSDAGLSEGDNAVVGADGWSQGLTAQSEYGYDWYHLTHSPDEALQRVLARAAGAPQNNNEEAVAQDETSTPIASETGNSSEKIASSTSETEASRDASDSEGMADNRGEYLIRYHHAFAGDRYGRDLGLENSLDDSPTPARSADLDEDRGMARDEESTDENGDNSSAEQAAAPMSEKEAAADMAYDKATAEEKYGYNADMDADRNVVTDEGKSADDGEDSETMDETAKADASDKAPWVVETPEETAEMNSQAATSTATRDEDSTETATNENTPRSRFDSETPDSMGSSSTNPYGYDYSTIREKYGSSGEEEKPDAGTESSADDGSDMAASGSEGGAMTGNQADAGTTANSSSSEKSNSTENATSTSTETSDMTEKPATSSETPASQESSGMGSESTDKTSTSQRERGLELFAWQPAELLLPPDQDLVRTIATLGDDSSAVRQTVLTDYVDSLGSDAREFATLCETTADVQLEALSGNVVHAAAFLATYRLYERGELGMAEAADLLRRSLNSLPQAWIDGVQRMADAEQNGEGHQVTTNQNENWWRWVSDWAGDTVRQVGGVASSVWYDPLPASIWDNVLTGRQTEEGAETYHAESPNDSLQR